MPTRRSARSSGCTANSRAARREAIATPEEARRANTELRQYMRTQDNYLPEIEELAEEQLKAVGHATGALTHRSVSLMAEAARLRAASTSTTCRTPPAR